MTEVRPVHDPDLERTRRYLATRDPALRDEILADHRGLTVALARRMARRGEPLDDLVQVAELAMLRALDRFDPDRGVAFAAFAVPTVMGELKRHFRDHTWSTRVPRPTKELWGRLSRAVEQAGAELGRAPTVSELAGRLGVREEDVLEAMEAGAGYRSLSMTGRAVQAHAEAAAGQVDDEETTDRTLTRVTVRRLVADLPARDQEILYLRFYEDLTQSEIGERMGISQMHVSRLLRRALATLAERLGEPGVDVDGLAAGLR